MKGCGSMRWKKGAAAFVPEIAPVMSEADFLARELSDWETLFGQH